VAALWNICGSWFNEGPHWFTSLTAALMELRSATLCLRSPARLVAACRSEICADDEAELADGVADVACTLL
jgi:hypothetical protein